MLNKYIQYSIAIIISFCLLTVSSFAGSAGQEESRYRPTAVRGDQPNILIMGEDADKDTIPRRSRVFKRVLNALTSEMRREGFEVFDETAVGLNITNPGRVRRTDAELITVARRIKRPPMDAALSFQIYASATKNAYSDIYDLSVRVTGRMFDAQSGRKLGNYEVAMGARDLDPLPVKCNRECILEHIGSQAKDIAHEVGAMLAGKLAHMSPARGSNRRDEGGAKDSGYERDAGRRPTRRSGRCTGLTRDYELTFKGFSSREITDVEESIARFKGLQHVRVIRAGSRLTEFSYKSCLGGAALNRKLRLMLEMLDLEGVVTARQTRYTVTRNARPKRR